MRSGVSQKMWPQPSAPISTERRRRRRIAGLLVSLLLGSLLWSPAAAVLTAEEARSKAGELKNSGVQAYEAGQLAKAIEDLQATININLNDFFAHYYLGLAYRDSRRYTEARQVLEVASQLDPRYLPVYVALGDVALGQGDPGAARAWYQTALNRQMHYAPALDGMGRLAEAKGDQDEAVERYKQAIEANPGFPMPYVHLGEAYRRAGKLDEAIQMFQEAINYRPDFAEAYIFLGVAYGDLERPIEAAALLEKAMELQPEDPKPLLALGRLLTRLDDRLRARNFFELAREMAPDLPQPLMGLAELARRDGHYDLAISLLDAAAALHGHDDELETSILANQTRYRSEQRRLEEIQMRMTSATGPAAAYTQLSLARLRRDASDLPGALEACLRALEPLQRPADLLFECGFYALSADRYGPAVELLEEALQKDPTLERAQVDLGLAYKRLGRLPSAVTAFKRALEINPAAKEAYLYLGNAYYRLGQMPDAEQAFRAALDLSNDPDEVSRIQKVLLHLDDLRLAPVPPEQQTAGTP